MAMNFPVTQAQLEQHLLQHGFITNTTLEEHLSEAQYVTTAKMREFISGELKTEHDALEARLTQSVQVVKDGVQAVHDKVVQDQAAFEARVSAANHNFEAANTAFQQPPGRTCSGRRAVRRHPARAPQHLSAREQRRPRDDAAHSWRAPCGQQA